jgi:hypothetical protein
MSNIIKYSESTSPNSIKSGNFNVRVNNTSTDLTGFYDGISPIIGGYTIYINKVSGGPSIYTPKDDTELIQITNRLGASVATAADALVWINSQSTMTVLNNNYPSIVTEGLVMNLDAGFVSSYPKTGTTWKDLSGSGNTGTLVNGPTFDANNNGSIIFDGVNDYIDISSIWNSFPIANTSFTLSAWVKVLNPTSQQEIIDVGQGQAPGITGFRMVFFNGEIIGQIMNGSTRFSTTGSIYQTNIYLNPVFTFDGMVSRLFINGIQIATTSLGDWIKGTTAEIGRQNNNAHFLSGNISQTQIYNRTLTPDEILQNYNATKSRYGL